MSAKRIAVIDIGKTNAKLALVDGADLSEIAVVTQPNTVLQAPPYPHFDVEMIWDFLLGALTHFNAQHGVDAISITTHGASGALIANDGRLAAPILDYEFAGPDAVSEDYDEIRPSFEETGSPRLPKGLNLGAQIYWQFLQDPGLRERTTAIVTYPQYWAQRLTGILACDVSSLGCHSDLWNPHEARFSSLVERLDISEKIAPAGRSSDVLGPLLPEIAAQTELDLKTPVYCGIHDSNASLLPHVMRRDPPYSVVSTGTWVIVMTVGGAEVSLDPSRDTLINVNALGSPVPSARFMGGREFEIMRGGHSAVCDQDVLEKVAENGPLLLPAVVSDSGPFQGRPHRWIGSEPAPGTPERSATLSFYLALMTAQCLTLTGHQGPIVIEGPFAANTAYCTMLSAVTTCKVLTTENATGTSEGAALLALTSSAASNIKEPKPHFVDDCESYASYAERWRKAVHN